MTPSTLLSPLLTYCADLPGFSPNAVEVAETEQRIGTMLSTLHHWERSAVEWRERAEGLHVRVAELEARVERADKAEAELAKVRKALKESEDFGKAWCEEAIRLQMLTGTDSETATREMLARPVFSESTKKPSALEQYNTAMEGQEDDTPIENLRFFLSIALDKQDWVDVEPFIDDLAAAEAELEARIEQADRLPLPVDFEGKPEDDTLDRMLVGRATEGDQMVIYNYVRWLEGRYSAARRMLGDRQAVTTTNAENIHRMAECAAIMTVCGYFSRMRGPIGHLVRNALLGSEYFVRGEAYELDDCEIAVPLYAGSAPVPAVPQAVDVDAICNAYESGVGHRGRPTANVNPYREGTPEHEAYAIGAKGEAAQADDTHSNGCPHASKDYDHPCACGIESAQAEAKVADDVDLWKFCRDVLKRGAEIESQLSQQGYETFIAEIEHTAKKEEKRLRAMLAAKAKGE